MNRFLDYRILVTDENIQETPIIKQEDTTILSRGNIACITGKAKSCKTFLVSAIASAFLESDNLTISKGIKNGTVLYVDTEQAKSHVQTVQQRIYRMCGWNIYSPDERLTTLALRKLSPEERRTMIEEAIQSLKPDLVIIDGVRDLIEDFNDIKSSASVVRTLMKLSDTFNCGILTVLHQNKSDNNARGHLGTELTNKSETVLQLTNIENKIIVSPDASRNQNIKEFAFQINEKGLPVLCNIPKNKESLKKEILNIMQPYKAMTKQAFIERFIQKTGNKKSSAYTKIKNAENIGIISTSGDLISIRE